MNPDREAERPSPPVAGDYSLGHRPARDRVKRGEIDRELAVTLDHHRRQPAKQQVGEIVVLDQQPSPAGAPTRLSQDQAILLIVEVTNRGKPADHTRRFDVSEVSLPAPQAGRSAAVVVVAIRLGSSVASPTRGLPGATGVRSDTYHELTNRQRDACNEKNQAGNVPLRFT